MQSLIQQQAAQVSTDSSAVQQLREAAEQGSIQNDKLIEHVAKLQQQIKEGLIDTTGSGANANIIRLTKELRDTVKNGFRDDSRAGREMKERAAAPSSSSPSTSPSDIEERTRESAGQYNRTNKDALKDIKKTFSVEGFFDFSPGKKRGMFGNVLANKVARDQYVKDEMETNPDILTQAGGDKKKAKKQLAEEFNQQQKIRGEQKQVQERIDTLKTRGYSEDDIKKSGLAAKRETLDNDLAGVDRRYARQREQEKTSQSNPEIPITSDQEMAPVTRAAGGDNVIQFPTRGNVTPVPNNVSGATEEIEQENLRMMEEQNDLLKKIEENTRVLGMQSKETPAPTPPAAGGNGSGGGGILGDLAGRGLRAAGRGARAAGSLIKKAGSGLLRAGTVAARFAGPAAAVAGAGYAGYKAGQWLNENTNIQQNIATGIDKVKGVFGASDDDKMKEADKNSAQASYDKRVAGGGKINQGLANMYKSQGIEVDESLVVSNEEWAKLDPATGKPKTEAAQPAAQSVTPVAPAPIAGPAADTTGVPAGSIPVKYNNELVGHMDPATNEIVPLKGMEEKVERVKSVKTRVRSQLDQSADNVGRVSPQSADNLVQQTNQTKQAQEEKESKQMTQPPVVISAPTQTTIQQTSNTSVRNPARNTESSLSQYNSGRFRYVPM